MTFAIGVLATEIMGAAQAFVRTLELESLGLLSNGPELSPGLLVGVALFQGVSMLGMLVLWHLHKRNLEQAHSQALAAAEKRGALSAAQSLTAYLSDRVTSRNSEILRWINQARSKGRTVSPRVESASRGIADSMAELSRTAFVDPYAVRKAPERQPRMGCVTDC